MDERLEAIIAQQPYPLCFVTLSGAHLYGFPSADSDYDLRGAHLLPVREVLGLGPQKETIDTSCVHEGVEMDLVTHDLRKFISLLLRRNGYALEQLYSPLVVVSTPQHEELKHIATGCITRHHHHHYLSFADHEWKRLQSHDDKRVKSLLYLFRVLLSGIHLMRTGEVEANLVRLNEEFALPYIPDLIALKLAGTEVGVVGSTEAARYEPEYHRLRQMLADAGEASHLPDKPTAHAALSDLLVRARLAQAGNGSREG
jgi:predicted nucleotidyltransferase